MEEIAVGVIGAGGMNARHAQNIAQHVVGARVAAVYDLDPVRAQQVAGMWGGAAVWIDPLELIGSTRVDAVLIATPDPFHTTLTRACLERGSVSSVCRWQNWPTAALQRHQP